MLNTTKKPSPEFRFGFSKKCGRVLESTRLNSPIGFRALSFPTPPCARPHEWPAAVRQLMSCFLSLANQDSGKRLELGNLFRSCPCSSDIITSRRGKWVQDREVRLLPASSILERTTTLASKHRHPAQRCLCRPSESCAERTHARFSRQHVNLSLHQPAQPTNGEREQPQLNTTTGDEDRSRVSTNRTDRASYLPTNSKPA